MKRVLYILVCLGLASIASALSITNGDFENQTGDDVADVADWYDYNNTAQYGDGPWFRGSGEDTINETGCLFLADTATSDEDGGHKAWIYQSLGTYDDIPMLEITLQWGADGGGFGGEMGLTVMILESDGTFVPGEPLISNDIYGAGGITEIARASITRDVDPGVTNDELFLLDISSATVGNELFLRINNFDVDEDTAPLMSVDNIALTSLSVTNQLPEDNAEFIAIERTSSENDLVFNVVDSTVSEVDVLFGTDPNLSQANKIKDIDSVTPGQYTVTLETEWPGDLENSKDYYWRVLAYEPNGVDVILRNEGKIWSFTAVQVGPYLDPATPNPNGVFAGEDAEFSVFSSKADTFQWYKSGDPNILLSDSDPNYSGTATDTLTIHDAQPANEGFYYCVGTETSSGKTATSESGELYIKRLKHYFPFNSDDVVDDKTLDVIGEVQAQLMGGASVETFSEPGYSEPNSVIGDYLKLDNPGAETEDTEYAQILDPNDVFDDCPESEITVSAWYRMASQDGKAVIWSCGEDIDNYWDFSPYVEYGDENEERSELRNEFRISSDQTRLSVYDVVNTNQWYFVTITFSGRTVKMYIDGEYVGTGKTYDTISDLTNTLAYIGRRVSETSSNYPKFNGDIDELKIYNYAMSTTEVGQAYLDVMAGVESVCNEEIYDLDNYDYDGNCQVDLADFAEIASRWLDDFQIL